VLLSFQDRNVENNTKTQEFLKSLQKNTRETDIKGWLENDVLGLILPDTDGRGVQKCIEKIGNGNGGLAFSVVAGTYPDDLFHKLLADESSQPNLFPINVDETEEPRKMELALKRAVDILGATIGLILFSPIMVVTSLSIKLTSPGPVIFTQNRFGKKGARFPFHKFRLMIKFTRTM
jgi:hypothetical protein